MSEHGTLEASPDTFDGDATSQADREFLASLGDHPLTRHPPVRSAVSTTARLRQAQTGRRQGSGPGSSLRGRRRLDAGELCLLQGRIHGQRRHHIAG